MRGMVMNDLILHLRNTIYDNIQTIFQVSAILKNPGSKSYH